MSTDFMAGGSANIPGNIDELVSGGSHHDHVASGHGNHDFVTLGDMEFDVSSNNFGLDTTTEDFGLGMDFAGIIGGQTNHDWSEGLGGVDLFDGFFFGNGAGGGSN